MTEQVLVTGISGFIAKQVALDLARAGYHVRGTVRSAARADEVRKTLESHGADGSRLSFLEADLGADAGWDEAVRGCAFVQHVASPFPIAQPRDREALVPEARDGALRVLKAARAADVRRVVLTSSMVAMMYRADRPPTVTVSESDWTDPEWSALSAYIVSKTRAERAAWEWADENEWRERLTVVNPGFVLGPTLDERTNTSIDVVKLLMDGAYPAVPPVAFATVDVRDLSALYRRAMTVENAGGRRLLGAAETVSMADMGRILIETFPEHARKVPTRTLPNFFVRFLSLFDRTLSTILPDLGVVPVADSAYVTELTGVRFRPAREAVAAAGQSLIDLELV